jgi:hypothetical protein
MPDIGWILDHLPALGRRWDLVLPLLAAHFLADFPMQPGAWVAGKRAGFRSPALYAHALLAAVLAYALIALWEAWIVLPVILASHLVIDGLKARFPDTWRSFLGDQLAHLLVVAGLVLALDARWPNPWIGWRPHPLWTLFVAWLLVWYVEGCFIGKATAAWQGLLGRSEGDDLERAGLWIGRLERSLILLLVLLGRVEAIGFLVAAKSIFRFEALKEGGRKEAEYILIGTMASFLLALLTGLAAVWLLRRAGWPAG